MEFLTDKNGHVIGQLIDHRNGSIDIQGPTGAFLGRYHTKTNQTFTATGRLIGSGNLLGTLIKPR